MKTTHLTPHFTTLIAALSVVLVSGCSFFNTESSDSSSPANTAPLKTGPFSLTGIQAENVIRQSIEAGWPSMETTTASGDYAGYSFLVWHRAQRDLVTVQAVPESDDRYNFQVSHDGSAPDEGEDASEKIADLLGNTAQALNE